MLIQKEIADHLDLSQQAASEWLDRLQIDWKVVPLSEIRVQYIRAIREQAAGRSMTGDLDLATERAGLARAQRVRIEMQNAVTKAELAPVPLIEEVLTKAAGKIAGIFDAIPGMVRRRVPKLSSAEVGLIAAEISKARNIVAAMSLADLDDTDTATPGAPN